MLEKGHKIITPGAHQGKGIGILTSGGDAQGMNAAVYAAVRMGRYMGCKVYFIKEGYQGIIMGGNFITEAPWNSVKDIIHKGGTFIGSARCPEFLERSGRMKAAINLIEHGISYLVIIGGDGSLIGADIFQQEWPQIIEYLRCTNLITAEQSIHCGQLYIVGIAGSIDNDLCGTDMTIGTQSALHRIIESIDVIACTASSHQRTFIMEVMGRQCGYLALVSAIISEADFVFIPEEPVDENWPEILCNKLSEGRQMGQRKNIIIVSEGATDDTGKPITSEDIRKVVVDKLHQDVRITVLGHIQRGGRPSAFDRVLGCRMGAEAVMALMEMTPDNNESCLMSLEGNKTMRIPLTTCVSQTNAVNQAINNKQWDTAVKLRGLFFNQCLDTYKKIMRLKPPAESTTKSNNPFVVGVMHVGSPAGGMNAAVRSFVRHATFRGYTVYGISNGFYGLIAGNLKPMKFSDVINWEAEGGAFLGYSRMLPEPYLKEVARILFRYKINALVLIGGFDAYQALLQLENARSTYSQFQIPLIQIPSTINNNVPGTELTLGCDTALNEIVDICDNIRQNAQGSKRRAFVLETTGGFCGYLTTLAGIATGADAAYIAEEKFTIKNLQDDVAQVGAKFSTGVDRAFIFCNEKASENYNTEFVYRLFREESKNIFTVRMHQLGTMQRGGPPSPFDRNMGSLMAIMSVSWISESFERSTLPDGSIKATAHNTAVVLGLIGNECRFTPVSKLKRITNFDHRTSRLQWWMKLRPLLKILGRHESAYEKGKNIDGFDYIYLNQPESDTLVI